MYIYIYILLYIGNNNPNWRTHIFQRGRYSTNQEDVRSYAVSGLYPTDMILVLFPWHPHGVCMHARAIYPQSLMVCVPLRTIGSAIQSCNSKGYLPVRFADLVAGSKHTHTHTYIYMLYMLQLNQLRKTCYQLIKHEPWVSWSWYVCPHNLEGWYVSVFDIVCHFKQTHLTVGSFTKHLWKVLSHQWTNLGWAFPRATASQRLWSSRTVLFICDWLVVWNMNFIFPFSWE